MITGGTSGIGLGMARALAAAGADVAVWARGERCAHDLAERLAAEFEVDAVGIGCDVAEPGDIDRATAHTLDRLGGIDACVTAAGINRQCSLLDMAPDEFAATLRTNLDGTFLTMRAMAVHMLQRGSGSLIAVSSIAGRRGQARTAHYAASKAAVTALVRTIAAELVSRGVRANVVTPGYVDTPLLADHLSSARFQQRVLPRIPLGRWGVPSDLGAVTVFLASDASAALTGREFTVDGGFLLNVP